MGEAGQEGRFNDCGRGVCCTVSSAGRPAAVALAASAIKGQGVGEAGRERRFSHCEEGTQGWLGKRLYTVCCCLVDNTRQGT